MYPDYTYFPALPHLCPHPSDLTPRKDQEKDDKEDDEDDDMPMMKEKRKKEEEEESNLCYPYTHWSMIKFPVDRQTLKEN